jgi:Peptidase family S41/N-terminal domain of Peptidase_S41 in eukaryotic IRBP
MKTTLSLKNSRIAIMTAIALATLSAENAVAQSTAPVTSTTPTPNASTPMPSPTARTMQASPPAQTSPLNIPPITASEKESLIAATVRELNNRYVFPDVAKRAGDAINAKFKAKAYDAITDGVALANALTDDLFALSKDSHLRFQFDPIAVPVQALPGQVVPEAQAAAALLDAKQRNFGFERVERLPGNIGYIDLRMFYSPESAGDTVAAAMNLVANTDALIFDLRQSLGGFSATVALITSYLLNERTLLNTFYSREDDSTEQSWSLDWLPGKRFGNTKPVYVLTSKGSISAAEEFAYNLKHLKRATIVGETTTGAANPGAFVKLTPLFTLFITNARSINAITKTNWEGVGVEPDVKVNADDALRKAQLLALEKIIGIERDPRRANGLRARVAQLEKVAQ